MGRDKTIEDDSYSIFAGIEYNLRNNIFFYLEIAGTPLELKEKVISGSTKTIARVNYSHVAVNVNLVFYAW